MHKIVVHSYRGGCGKTLILLNLAQELTKRGKRVLIVETDIRMPNFQSILKLDPKFTLNDCYEGKCTFSELPIKYSEGISAIFCETNFEVTDRVFSADKSVHANFLSKQLKGLNHLSNKFDYCLYDSAPGWGFIQINNGLIGQTIYLVIRANENSVEGTINMIDKMYRNTIISNQDIYAIWNQIPNHKNMKSLINKWENQLLVKDSIIKKFYQIQYDDNLAYQVASGEHFFDSTNEFIIILNGIINDLNKNSSKNIF